MLNRVAFRLMVATLPLKLARFDFSVRKWMSLHCVAFLVIFYAKSIEKKV